MWHMLPRNYAGGACHLTKKIKHHNVRHRARGIIRDSNATRNVHKRFDEYWRRTLTWEDVVLILCNNHYQLRWDCSFQLISSNNSTYSYFMSSLFFFFLLCIIINHAIFFYLKKKLYHETKTIKNIWFFFFFPIRNLTIFLALPLLVYHIARQLHILCMHCLSCE